jgi:hypothetical protein
MCGLIKPVFRLPYVPLSREQRQHGAELLRRVQQHIPGCKVGPARWPIELVPSLVHTWENSTGSKTSLKTWALLSVVKCGWHVV